MTKKQVNVEFIKEVLSMADKERWLSSRRAKFASRLLLGLYIQS